MKRNLTSLSLVMITGILFLLLSGCYVPENFDIKVKVNKDGQRGVYRCVCGVSVDIQ